MSNAVLKVRDAASNSIASKHPWVLVTSLSKNIQSIEKDSVVDLVDQNERFVGRGIFNPDSRIAVRVYTWDENEAVDEAMFERRIAAAFSLRKSIGEFPTSEQTIARRLVFSEADRLSGLIVDAYGPYLVIQITSSGMRARLDLLVSILQRHYPAMGITLRIDESTAAREGIEPANEVIFGQVPAEGISITENDVQFHVDLLLGQKTGHYLDQRRNRLAASQWIAPESKILDVCSYTGGFSCTLGRYVSGAHITAIDSSQKALDLAKVNAELNGFSNIEFEQNDFYQALEKRLNSGQKYDAIILDPPRMASARSQVDRALAAYHRLNYLAVRLLKVGGILVTCSCSGRVARLQFQHMLLGVSKRSGREIQILEQRAASEDHPMLINCPETDYLKCFICKIL